MVLQNKQKVKRLYIEKNKADSLYSLFREYSFFSTPFDIVLWRIGHNVSRHKAARHVEIDVINPLTFTEPAHKIQQ
jgi:hypothetical protein